MAQNLSFQDADTYAAKWLRRLPYLLLAEGIYASLQWTDPLKVVAQATPDMSVNAQAGDCLIQGEPEGGTQFATDYGTMLYTNDGVVNLAISASDPTLNRIDIVVVKCYDDGTAGGSKGQLEVVTGTAAASPSVPATPANAYKLAEVYVGAAVTSITNANITDRRAQATLSQVVIPTLELSKIPVLDNTKIPVLNTDRMPSYLQPANLPASAIDPVKPLHTKDYIYQDLLSSYHSAPVRINNVVANTPYADSSATLSYSGGNIRAVVSLHGRPLIDDSTAACGFLAWVGWNINGGGITWSGVGKSTAPNASYGAHITQRAAFDLSAQGSYNFYAGFGQNTYGPAGHIDVDTVTLMVELYRLS